MRLLATTSVIAGALGCSEEPPVGAGDADRLVVRIGSTALEITNVTRDRVYFSTFDASLAARTSFVFAPCRIPEECPSVGPRATVVVPFSQIAGFGGGQYLILYHWLLTPTADGGYAVRELRSMEVNLRRS